MITKKAAALCDADPDRSMGFNCCAICAAMPGDEGEEGGEPVGELLLCECCSSVRYCSQAHMVGDKEAHDKVCKLLALMEQAQQVEVSEEQEAKLLALFLQKRDACTQVPGCDLVAVCTA